MALLTNLTGANEIGANCYHLQLDDKWSVVLDAGMHPKRDGYAALPRLQAMPSHPQATFLTHAHHDHSGALPLLMQACEGMRVFMSEATIYLADALLHNSVNVMKKQRVDAGIEEYPLFTHQQINQLVNLWQGVKLGDTWSLEGFPVPSEYPGPTFRFHQAGHILGSVAVELRSRHQRILYTGDVNLRPQTLMPAAQLPERDIDVLITETTRGAQPTSEDSSRAVVESHFLQAIRKTYENGGCVLIPIFAMGKTQELLVILHRAMCEGMIPSGTIHIGGLSKVFTEIYDRLASISERRLSQVSLRDEIKPEVMDYRKLFHFKPKRGDIYLLSSGMMNEHTLSNTLAHRFLNRPENGIFFVGYTDPDSPAGHLRRTPIGDEVVLNRMEGPIKVRAQVRHFDFTAHALREDLLDYIVKLNPRCCVLVHGDEPALAWFAESLAEKAPQMRVIIPPPGQSVVI